MKLNLIFLKNIITTIKDQFNLNKLSVNAYEKLLFL